MSKSPAWSASLLDCHACGTTLLLRMPLLVGDRVDCPKCKARTTVDKLLDEVRGKNARTSFQGEIVANEAPASPVESEPPRRQEVRAIACEEAKPIRKPSSKKPATKVAAQAAVASVGVPPAAKPGKSRERNLFDAKAFQ